MSPVQVAHFLAGTRVEGPGVRIAIWTQGCSIKCPNCFNPELWGKKGGVRRTVEELLEQIQREKAENEKIEGVTFLGGEPFDQAEQIARLASGIRSIGLSVVTFTGHYLADLDKSLIAGHRELLAQTDLLIDGPFLQEAVDKSRPWLGSTNQNYQFLTNRYSEKDVRGPDLLEVKVSKSGGVSVNGWTSTDVLEDFLGSIP